MTLHELVLKPEGGFRDFDDTAAWGAFFDRSIRSITILLLPFLAIGLGVVSKRQQRSLGMVVGLVMLLTLHKSVEFAVASANLGATSAIMSMTMPFFVFLVLTLLFYHVTAHIVGGSPLAWLERGMDSLGGLLSRFSVNKNDETAATGNTP